MGSEHQHGSRNSKAGWDTSSREALRPALIYFLLSIVWILVSDLVLLQLTEGPAEMARLQTIKGWVFVVFSSLLLFVLVRRSLQNVISLQMRLQRTEKLDALGNMAAGIAHDFNNVLSVVRGWVELLGSRQQSDAEFRIIDRIMKALDDGRAMSDRLRSVTSFETFEGRVEDINKLVSDVSPLLRQAISPNLQLKVVQHASPVLVFVQRIQFEDALLNLAINARHATEGTGDLLIRVRVEQISGSFHRFSPAEPGSYVVVDVRDWGSGMDEALVGRVLEPFFTTKGKDGSGLGLSQVYSFVRSNRGDLTINSEVGNGTTVSLYLPVYPTVRENEQSKPGDDLQRSNVRKVRLPDASP